MKKSEWKDDLKIGDVVKVKEGIICPDCNDLTISGWKGEVIDISEDDEDNIIICVEWDLVTAQNMPDSFVDQGEEDGLDNELMYLSFEDVELIKKSAEFIKIERTIWRRSYGLETKDKLIKISGEELGGFDLSLEFKDQLWEDMSIDIDELMEEFGDREDLKN